MGNSATKISDKTVVVVGSGYAGVAMVQLLEASFENVIVVERGDGWFHKIGGVRAAVTPSWAELCVLPLDKAFKSAKRVKGSVVSFDKDNNKLVLDSGEEIKFDYCVFAMGGRNASVCEAPASAGFGKDAIIKHFAEVADLIKKAKKIVVAGGGPVGVELVAEIQYSYPSKNLTIVANGDSLCADPEFPAPAFTQKLKQKFDARKINVVFNEKVVFPDVSAGEAPASYVKGPLSVKLTNGGEAIEEVDLVLRCIGMTPNTGFVPDELKDDRGFVKVNEYFQVEGISAGNVFAMGDCCNTAEAKLSMVVSAKKDMPPFSPMGHPDYILANVVHLIKGNQDKLAAYKPTKKKAAFVVPLGKGDGVATGAPGFFATYKSKNFFIPMFHGKVKSKAPALPPVIREEA